MSDGILYKRVARPLLFSRDPETAHSISKKLLSDYWRLIPQLRVDDERLSQELLGRKFENPVGIAAGFDKNAELIAPFQRLGFGFVEVGTVVPRPQPGNPKPRIYRFAEQEAMQNAMGFNSAGIRAVRRNLEGYPFGIPVGVNIGKNEATPNEEAVSDYIIGIRGFASRADYITVNISSPNAPGLRDLQNEEFIAELFSRIRDQGIASKPVLLKLSPDISTDLAATLSDTAVKSGAAGIVATNTTTDYSLLRGATPRQTSGKLQGGISGKPLRERSYEILKAVSSAVMGKAVIIAVGGIDSGEEAFRRILAGASLVQVYTGLVYQGPGIARFINMKISSLLQKSGFGSLSEAVGHLAPH